MGSTSSGATSVTGVESLETFSDADLERRKRPGVCQFKPRLRPQGYGLEGVRPIRCQFLRYSPREAQILDPQQRIFLECAWEALEHAGYAAGGTGHKAVGVYAGASMNTYLT